MILQPLIDLHTHTIASGHAYSTLKENIEEAIKVGLKVYGHSEHAPMMPGSARPMYFRNFRVIPRQIGELRIFNGIEANICDGEGGIDIKDSIVAKLDYVIASMHSHCISDLGLDGNTGTLIKATENPNINIIGHPDDSRFPIDVDALAAAAVKNNTALELNNSSLNPRSSRKNGPQNIRRLLAACKKYGTMIIMGTDSHICWQVGRFDAALEVLRETKFPLEQVINFDLSLLSYVIPPLKENL